MISVLGLGCVAVAIARFSVGLIDGLIIVQADADQVQAIEASGIRALVAPTVMTDLDDRIALAGTALAFARTLPAPAQARSWHAPPVVCGGPHERQRD
jgi:LPPG:FO 2-phospho-L-lactate transferase